MIGTIEHLKLAARGYAAPDPRCRYCGTPGKNVKQEVWPSDEPNLFDPPTLVTTFVCSDTRCGHDERWHCHPDSFTRNDIKIFQEEWIAFAGLPKKSTFDSLIAT